MNAMRLAAIAFFLTGRAFAEALEPGEYFADELRDGGRGPEMVVVPSGSFEMGCVSGWSCDASVEPVHTVTIVQPFAVSIYEITFKDYDRFSTPNKVNDQGWGRGSRPTIDVSWNDAKAYVAWLSKQTGHQYRLLTEAEWEYAARAESTTLFFWGNHVGYNKANCNACGSQWDGEKTAPVGSFMPNSFGLYDMHGNLWEWVEDCWNRSYLGAPSDGSAWRSGNCEGRVVRSGAWRSFDRGVSSATRNWKPTEHHSYFIGFRVARTLDP